MISISTANPYEQPLDFAGLKDAARAVLAGEKVTAAKIVLAFINNEHMQRLNKQFLEHDEPTDVMTFPYSKHTSAKLEGEVVMSYEIAAEYAADRGHEMKYELLLYVIHGCLHLCGYDDRNDKQSKQMRKKEREYLKKLKLPDVAGE